MKPSTTMRNGFVALALSAMSLVMGCSTYHYYDIDVEFGPVSSEQASQLQLCVLVVSGADSHEGNFPSSAAGDDTSTCPPLGNYPKMGTFEYSTFTDSGSLTFTINGYGKVNPASNLLCTSGSTTMNASSEITQSGSITMGSFNSTNCPSMIMP